MKKIIALLIVISSANSLAINFFTKKHGVGLPASETNSSQGQQYRERIKRKLNITSYQENGLTFYNNSNKGLYLIKKANLSDNGFKNIIKDADKVRYWNNGNSFIQALKDHTKANGCIDKVTSVSHGWASKSGRGEGHGLSGSYGKNGLYATEQTRPQFLLDRLGTATVNGKLRQAVKMGEIKFCKTCLLQFYACNISTYFADVFATISQCQTVVGTGQVSPKYQSTETDLDRAKTYSAFHHWSSVAGLWEERGQGQWYRVTPVKDDNGKLRGLVKENIGNTYLAL